jgi:predicted DNA-binding antitoxin AbrB/MazE fold protein
MNTREKATPKPTTIRCLAQYKDGVLQPQEPLDLPDGAHVEIMLRLRK